MGNTLNIQLINNSAKESSPSDFLCTQSLDEIKPLSVIHKRHMHMVNNNNNGKSTDSSKDDTDDNDNDTMVINR
jgi:hypothetical protein